MGFRAHTTKHQDDGLIHGKKVYLFLVVPAMVLFLMAVAAWGAFALYAKKFIVNENPEICNVVRKEYRGTLRDDFPCEVTDDDTKYMVTFSLNPNDPGNVPMLMSFLVDKESKAIEPTVSK